MTLVTGDYFTLSQQMSMWSHPAGWETAGGVWTPWIFKACTTSHSLQLLTDGCYHLITRFRPVSNSLWWIAIFTSHFVNSILLLPLGTPWGDSRGIQPAMSSVVKCEEPRVRTRSSLINSSMVDYMKTQKKQNSCDYIIIHVTFMEIEQNKFKKSILDRTCF